MGRNDQRVKGDAPIREDDFVSTDPRVNTIMESVRIYYQRHDGETGQMRLRFDKDLGVGELFKSNPKAFKHYTHMVIQAAFHFLIHPALPKQTDIENKIEVEYPSNYFDDDGIKKH